MNYAGNIKKRLMSNAVALGYERIPGNSAFVFQDLETNFNGASYKNIDKHSDWKRRIQKKHTHFKGDILEMQSCNSSDALLMNIFCHPKISSWKGLSKLLKVNFDHNIEFGWQGVDFFNEGPYKT